VERCLLQCLLPIWFLAGSCTLGGVLHALGGLDLALLLALAVFAVILLTEISSNTATASALLPIFASVAVELGLGCGPSDWSTTHPGSIAFSSARTPSAVASSGIRQSPRGEIVMVPTLGPAGNVVRLN